MPCRQYLVSGHVQGVFFRATTQEIAIALGLRGWVRNGDDGQVELMACGDEAALGELERWLRHGPPRAQVTAVARTDVPVEVFPDFRVVP